jgi:Predicted periplasmic or secreted lipoprotein
MKVKEVLRLLREDGWYLVNQEGSHRQFKHPTKPGRVTVAGKPGETLHPKTLASILRQAKLQEKGDD